MESYCIQKAIDCAGRNQSKHLEGFKALLRIPSISLDAAYQPQLRDCANFVLGEMERIGLQNGQLLPTAGNPILYADWLGAGADKPTILFYAHYDVQPVGDASLWKSPPFEPTLVDDRLVARGAVDDKCGIWINLKAIESILSACGELPINVNLFFEGEEELGSKNVGPFVTASKGLLAADAVIISDGAFFACAAGDRLCLAAGRSWASCGSRVRRTICIPGVMAARSRTRFITWDASSRASMTRAVGYRSRDSTMASSH